MRALMKSLGDIWRLAIPYFTTRDIGEARVWPFRYRAQERWIGLSLLVAVIGIELGQVGHMNVGVGRPGEVEREVVVPVRRLVYDREWGWR